MGSIKFNTNRTKVDLTGVTETESSTLSGKGKQTAVLPTYKPNFKDVNLTTIQAQAKTPVFKSVTTPRKYTTPTKKPKIELPKYTPFTNEEVGLLQHQSRIPMAMPKSDLRDKAALNTEYALKVNPGMYGRMEGFSPLATKKRTERMLGQQIDTGGIEDSLRFKVGYGVGLMGQYMTTGGVAHGAVRAGLTKAIPQLAQNAGRSTAKNVLGVMGASALADVLTGVPINTVQAIKESTVGEEVNWNQFAKSFAVNTAIDVVFGGLIEGGLVLKSGKKIKTVGDLKTVTPDESKEITEQLMLNSPKYKENLMLNAPTNKLLNIPQKQLTHPVNYVDELGNISNEPNFNAAKNVLQEEPYVKNKIKVTVKRPSGNYEKLDDDWDFGWDDNDINLINGWIEFSKSNGRTATKLLKSQLNKTQIEIDKAFDEAKDYFLNYKGKGVDLVEMVDLPGRKVRESLNDEWYRRWYKKNKKVPTKKEKLQIAEEEFMEDIRAASDGNRDGEFVSEELAKRYSLFNKLENMFNKLPDDTINVELRGEDDMSAFLGQETRIVKPDYTKKPFIERVETPKRVYAGELPQGAKLPENTLSKKIIEKKKAEPIILGGKVEEPSKVKPIKVSEKPEVIGKGNMGDVVRKGDYVYKNTVNKNGKKTLEAEVYSALKGNDNILDGKLVKLNGVEKIKTPYSKNIVSIDTIPKEKRASIGKNIVASEYDNIVKAINDLSNKGYNYSDPLQFAFVDNKLKLMDFSNVWKQEVKDATDANYSHLSDFFRAFGLKHLNKKIRTGMGLRVDIKYESLEDIANGTTFLKDEEKGTVIDLLNQKASANNVYTATNARMVQLGDIAQTDKIDGTKYIFSEKPLTAKQIDEWELSPLYTTEEFVAKSETKIPTKVAKAEPKEKLYGERMGYDAKNNYSDNNSKLLDTHKYWEDEVNAKWIAEVSDKAKANILKGETGQRATFIDKRTAGYDNPLMLSPTKVSKNINGGLRNEKPNINKINNLTESIQKDGYNPKEPVIIAVDAKGKAWVLEGNHRLVAALKANIDEIPVDVKYFDGGERTNGYWKPDILLENNFAKVETKIPTKFKSVEAELKSLTAEMKATPPTETQIKRYKQLKAQVKPAKIPTREPVSTVEPVKAAKPTLTPKTEKNIPNAVKTDNPYLNTITNATEKTKAEKRLGENITFVNNKGNLTKATRKEYIEDMAMIDGSQIKTTQKLRTNGGKTFEVNEYRVYKTPNSKEPIKISKYEKDYFDFAKKNQDNVVQSVTPYKKPIKKVDKALPPKNTTNPIDLVMASSKKAQKGFKESVIDRGLEVKRKFVDSGDTVAIIGKITGDKGLYHSYNKARSSTRSAEHVLGEAQTNIIGDKVGKSLKDIFKPIRKKGDGYYNDFQLYLLHKHNVDRMAQGKPVFGEDITADISIAEANKLLKEYPEFEELAQKIYTFNKNNMQYRIDADLITAEQAKMFEEMYPHYVPTIRAKKSTPQPPKNSKTDVTGKIAQTIKGATGDSSPILPLHQSMARQTMQTVTAAEKNIFANRLIKNVTPETSRYIQDMNSIIKDFDLDSELVNAMKSKKESEELKNYFTLFRNGEAYQVKVDEGLFEGLEALTSSNRSTDAIIDAVTAGNTMFKQLITGYSPTFLVRNGARDLQDVGLYSKNLREFTIQYPKAIKEMTSNGELWQRYKALGGTGSSFFDYAKGFKKEPTFLRKNTLNKIENLNMAVEQLPRFTEFMATLSKGDGSYDNLLEALYNSADITVNFGRAGTWGKTLNQTFVPFFNPAMQGFDKLARTLKYTKGWKDWTKLTIKATALGITPALINELVYSDDPDYANLYSRDKDINYLFKLDNNVWIRIPKGRVLSLIGGAAQRTVRLASGDKDAYAGFIKVAKEQVAPISPFESNIVSPILAVQNNKAWHGGTIEPQRLTGSAGLRYDESTTAPAKWLGAKLNYSPKKIDYLVDAYTGIIGDLAIPLTTPQAEVHPFAKAFTIDGATTNRISQDFYDKKTEISESYSDNKDNISYIQNRYLNKQSDMASELFEEIRTVQNSKLTDVQKRTKVREIRALINVIEKNALDSLPEVEKTTKKLVNKYSDTDDLYREVNREVFGSEYALKLYNKTVYEKAQTYVTEKARPSFNKNVATIPQKNGVTWDNYYDGYFAQKDEASDISKAVALQGKNITTLYDAFGISDKNANIAAALSKNDLGKAYNSTYQKISDSEATKSAEKIAIINQNNPTLSTSELRILYEAFNVAESIGRYTRKYN